MYISLYLRLHPIPMKTITRQTASPMNDTATITSAETKIKLRKQSPRFRHNIKEDSK